MQQERECKIRLNQAENTWAANPTEAGAQQAASILNQIDPNTTCYTSAKALIAKINASIKAKLADIEAFERKMRLMETQNEQELNKERIKAARDISVAYYNSRPSTVVYNFNGWW